MLNRDDLFDAIGGIEDDYIGSAAALLYNEKEDTMNKNTIRSTKKAASWLLIAAAVTLLTAAALAAVFAFSHRVPASEEGFPFQWDGGTLEWTDAKLAVTLPETPVSQEVEFRPGWLPFALEETMPNCVPWENVSAETWFRRFTSEGLHFTRPEYSDIWQPLMIEQYAMSQFNNDGAMILLYGTPGEIKEDHWDKQNVDVMTFTAANEHQTFNYVLLANAQEGWVVKICGELPMEDMVRAAKNLEIRTTGKTLTYGDFDSHNIFFDGGVG